MAGGALSAAVVPLLARPLAAATATRSTGRRPALLTWAVLVLAPVALLLALLAGR